MGELRRRRSREIVCRGDQGTRYLGTRRNLATLFLCLLVFPASLASASEDPLPWVSPQLGLARALQQRQPVLVLLESPGDPDPARHLEEQLQSSSIARSIRDVVLIRVVWKRGSKGEWLWPEGTDREDGDREDDDREDDDREDAVDSQDAVKPWSRERVRKHVEMSLGKPSERTVIGILDLFARQRARHPGKKISASALKKGLRAASQECRVLSRKWDAATKILDAATLLLSREETAPCCRQLGEVEKLKLPAEAPPSKRRGDLLALLEKRWRERMTAARDMEKKNRLGEAASAYEKILKDFPHPPWEKEIRAEIGRVWKRIQGPGGGLR